MVPLIWNTAAGLDQDKVFNITMSRDCVKSAVTARDPTWAPIDSTTVGLDQYFHLRHLPRGATDLEHGGRARPGQGLQDRLYAGAMGGRHRDVRRAYAATTRAAAMEDTAHPLRLKLIKRLRQKGPADRDRDCDELDLDWALQQYVDQEGACFYTGVTLTLSGPIYIPPPSSSHSSAATSRLVTRLSTRCLLRPNSTVDMSDAQVGLALDFWHDQECLRVSTGSTVRLRPS